MSDYISKKWFFFFAAFIFVAGIILTIYNIGRGKFTGTDSKTKSDNQVGEPAFEIGYLVIDLSIVESLLKKDSSVNNDAFLYPVLDNPVTKRIMTDSPLVVPDYGRMSYTYDYLEGFMRLHRKHKVMLSKTSVACLLVKQKGAGKAYQTILEYNKVHLPAHDMYDGTDINYIIKHDSTNTDTPGFLSVFDHSQFNLDSMDTGSGILIPLCILNFFRPHDRNDTNEDAWKQLTDGIVIIPSVLSYRNQRGDTARLDMQEFLMRPVLLEK
jgi:hypothetical protein